MSDPATASTSAPLRFAFIGAGGIANQYLGALDTYDDVEVVGFADPIEKPMHEKAEKHGLSTDACFTDYGQMLKQLKPDAVAVCSPNGAHAPNTIAALEAGADVIVEKPMAMNASEARSMIDAAERNGRKLVIGFQFRYDPRTAFIIAQREAGVLGDLRFGRVWALRRRGIPNWGVFGRKDLQGGGPMIDIGVHALEMCHFAMGAPKPVAATGMADTYMGNSEQTATGVVCPWPDWDWKTYTVEDLAVGSIRFDNGAVIHIESCFAAHHEHAETTMDFQLMGTKGGAKWAEPEVFTDQNGYMVNTKPAWLPKNDWSDYFNAKLRNFIDHVTKDTPTQAPAQHGLMVQQMLDAIYRSAENGGAEVAID